MTLAEVLGRALDGGCAPEAWASFTAARATIESAISERLQLVAAAALEARLRTRPSSDGTDR